MPFFGIPNPIKGIRNQVRKASNFIAKLKHTRDKPLLIALSEGDEDKAMELYMAVTDGTSLIEDWNPSNDPEAKAYVGQTALHIACRNAMISIFELFIRHGGNPAKLNGNMQTCLHCICIEIKDNSDNNHNNIMKNNEEMVMIDNKRNNILKVILEWKSNVDTGESGRGSISNANDNDNNNKNNDDGQQVSLNSIDSEGNAAIHYASASGLIECVHTLVAAGAIISIVNKDQKTCCELADPDLNNNDLNNINNMNTLIIDDEGEEDDQDIIKNNNRNSTNELVLNEQEGGKIGASGTIKATSSSSTSSISLLRTFSSNSKKSIKNNNIMSNVSGSKVLADALEIALVYQPSDDSILAYEDSAMAEELFPFESSEALLYLDSSSIPATGVSKWATTVVTTVASTTGLPLERAEALLFANSWDKNQVIIQYSKSAEETLKRAHMSPEKSNKISTTTSSNGNNNDADIKDESKDEISEKDTSSSSSSSSERSTTCSVCADELGKPCTPADILSGKIPKDDIDRVPLVCLAGHSFCLECFTTFSSMQIKDGTGVSLVCPGYQCNECVSQNWFEVVFRDDEDLGIRMLRQRLHRIVNCCGELRSCVGDNCSEIICGITAGSPDIESNEFTLNSSPRSVMCRNGHMFCLLCNNEAHTPASCEEYTQWNKRIEEQMAEVGDTSSSTDGKSTDDIANAMWLAANTRKCPRCNTSIEKDEGCNHMTCRTCRYEFCWICRQPWRLHSNATGGYFQCNRFQDGEVYDESMGSSQADALRHRYKNKQMALFIHYYTRFRAHADSLGMEGRLREQTMNRIARSLKKSLDPKIKSKLQLSNTKTTNSKTTNRLSGSSIDNDIRWLQGSRVEHPLRSACKLLVENNNNNHNDENNTSSSNGMTTPGKGTYHSTSSSSSSASEVKTENEIIAELISDTELELFTSSMDDICQEAMIFLSKGFRELLICRSFLKGCYVYAFNHFASTRRNSALEGKKRQFEHLQGELESFVEMLSDVLARRRLRAGRDQITQLTRASRSKRLELESAIVATWFDDMQRAARQRARDERRMLANRDQRDLNGSSSSSSSRSVGREGRSNRRTRRQAREEEESLSPLLSSGLESLLGSDTDIGELASVLEEMGLTPEELQALQDENEILTMVAQMDFADQMNREQNMGEVKNLPNTDTAPPLPLPPTTQATATTMQTMLGDVFSRGGGRTADVRRAQQGLHARDTHLYADRDYSQGHMGQSSHSSTSTSIATATNSNNPISIITNANAIGDGDALSPNSVSTTSSLSPIFDGSVPPLLEQMINEFDWSSFMGTEVEAMDIIYRRYKSKLRTDGYDNLSPESNKVSSGFYVSAPTLKEEDLPEDVKEALEVERALQKIVAAKAKKERKKRRKEKKKAAADAVAGNNNNKEESEDHEEVDDKDDHQEQQNDDGENDGGDSTDTLVGKGFTSAFATPTEISQTAIPTGKMDDTDLNVVTSDAVTSTAKATKNQRKKKNSSSSSALSSTSRSGSSMVVPPPLPAEAIPVPSPPTLEVAASDNDDGDATPTTTNTPSSGTSVSVVDTDGKDRKATIAAALRASSSGSSHGKSGKSKKVSLNRIDGAGLQQLVAEQERMQAQMLRTQAAGKIERERLRSDTGRNRVMSIEDQEAAELQAALQLSLQPQSQISHSRPPPLPIESNSTSNSNPSISEDAIMTLVSMGFKREDVVRVLQECGDNLQSAADRLLGI